MIKKFLVVLVVVDMRQLLLRGTYAGNLLERGNNVFFRDVILIKIIKTSPVGKIKILYFYQILFCLAS